MGFLLPGKTEAITTLKVDLIQTSFECLRGTGGGTSLSNQ